MLQDEIHVLRIDQPQGKRKSICSLHAKVVAEEVGVVVPNIAGFSISLG